MMDMMDGVSNRSLDISIYVRNVTTRSSLILPTREEETRQTVAQLYK